MQICFLTSCTPVLRKFITLLHIFFDRSLWLLATLTTACKLQICSEFGLQNGTTYNSYIVEGDKLAVIDASHEKFRDLYLAALKEEIDPSNIDYILANHTEPDHSGLIPDLLNLAPDAVVVGSKVCIQFLQSLMLRPFKSMVVKVNFSPSSTFLVVFYALRMRRVHSCSTLHQVLLLLDLNNLVFSLEARVAEIALF